MSEQRAHDASAVTLREIAGVLEYQIAQNGEFSRCCIWLQHADLFDPCGLLTIRLPGRTMRITSTGASWRTARRPMTARSAAALQKGASWGESILLTGRIWRKSPVEKALRSIMRMTSELPPRACHWPQRPGFRTNMMSCARARLCWPLSPKCFGFWPRQGQVLGWGRRS